MYSGMAQQKLAQTIGRLVIEVYCNYMPIHRHSVLVEENILFGYISFQGSGVKEIVSLMHLIEWMDEAIPFALAARDTGTNQLIPKERIKERNHTSECWWERERIRYRRIITYTHPNAISLASLQLIWFISYRKNWKSIPFDSVSGISWAPSLRTTQYTEWEARESNSGAARCTQRANYRFGKRSERMQNHNSSPDLAVNSRSNGSSHCSWPQQKPAVPFSGKHSTTGNPGPPITRATTRLSSVRARGFHGRLPRGASAVNAAL
jgi:hypothetical protein